MSKITDLMQGRYALPTVVFSTFMLVAASVFLPAIGVLFAFIWTIPAAVLTAKRGFRLAFFSYPLLFFLLTPFLSPPQSALVALNVILPALLFGYGVYKNFSAVKTLLLTFLGEIISYGANFTLVYFAVGFTDAATIAESVGEMQSLKAYDKELVVETAREIYNLIPFIITLAAAAVAVIHYNLNAFCCKRLDIKINRFPPFHLWHFSRWFFFVLAFSVIGIYWGSVHDMLLLYQISVNTFMTVFVLGIVSGFAFLFFMFERFKISLPFRIAIVTLCFLSFFALEFVAITGLFDMIFNYRKFFRENVV